MPRYGETSESLARDLQHALAELGEEVSEYNMPPEIPLDTLRKIKPRDVEVHGLLGDCGPGFWHPEPQKIEQKLKKVFALALKTYGDKDWHTANVMNSYACWLKTRQHRTHACSWSYKDCIGRLTFAACFHSIPPLRLSRTNHGESVHSGVVFSIVRNKRNSVCDSSCSNPSIGAVDLVSTFPTVRHDGAPYFAEVRINGKRQIFAGALLKMQLVLHPSFSLRTIDTTRLPS